MQVIISTRGLTVSKTYKDAVSGKLAKLEPMLPKIVEMKVVLSKEKHRRTAAITVVAKKHTLRSEETAGDLAAAVDMAVDALLRQGKALKERLKDRKGRNARRLPRPMLPPVSPAPAMPEVAVTRVPLKPMSVAEAVEQLRTTGDECLLFANAGTDAVSVLYQRRGGGLGLIEPQ
ncbi:MAG TPA: ribosome-associated translation inhibitor RaiA [Methylomirabilota bacterium]|nr:ribosome-associated translation inhibitor RaiA [Methylomirabilota bacterium]